MTKTYELKGPKDADSREQLTNELNEIPGVHDVDITEGQSAEESVHVALSGLGFTDDEVEDAAAAAGYQLKS